MNNTKKIVIITNGCNGVDVDPLPLTCPSRRILQACHAISKGNDEKCTKHIVSKIIGFPVILLSNIRFEGIRVMLGLGNENMVKMGKFVRGRQNRNVINSIVC